MRRRRRTESPVRWLDAAPAVSLTALLHPANEVVTFAGRAGELSGLHAWCADAAANPVVVLTGPGGVGKTRLSLKLGQDLAARRWQVLAVTAGGEAHAVEYVTNLDSGEQLLVVVDYAEARDSAALAGLVAAVAAARGRRYPPRLLLLARQAGDWWTYLSEYAQPLHRQLVSNVVAGADVLDVPVQLGAGTPAEVVAAAAQAFAARLNRPVPTDLPTLFAAGAPVLKLHTAALLTVLGDTPDEHTDVIAQLLAHESGYWLARARIRWRW